jgi:hypothetical protein
MNKTIQIISIEPDSELARALQEDEIAPVVLESNGVHFRVLRDADDIWARYDPERLLATVRAAAGTLTPKKAKSSRNSSIAVVRKVPDRQTARELSRRFGCLESTV